MEDWILKELGEGYITTIRTVLRSMPPRECMDKGKGYDDMIGYATCSLSQCLMQ